MAPIERPRLSTGTIHHAPRPEGLAPDDHPALHTWPAQVAAVHIGTPALTHPEALASIAHREAILRAGSVGAVR